MEVWLSSLRGKFKIANKGAFLVLALVKKRDRCLDFLKVLPFSFPVPVVGLSVKDFYPLQRAKLKGGTFLLWVLSNYERFY